MADLLQQGSNWLEDMRTAHASQPVTYSRSGEQIIVQATIGKTSYEVEDDYGLRVQGEVIDFLIRADDLVLAGAKTEPQEGDQIRISRADKVEVFEVMNLAGQGHFRYSDSFGKTLRIHTRQIGSEQ